MLQCSTIAISIIILILKFSENVNAIVVDSSHVQSQIMQFDYNKVDTNTNILTVSAINITSKLTLLK